MDNNLIEKVGAGVLIFSLAWFILSLYMCYWAYKRKGIVGFLLAFFLNWIGWIIVAFLPKEEKPERERELELGWYYLQK